MGHSKSWAADVLLLHKLIHVHHSPGFRARVGLSWGHEADKVVGLPVSYCASPQPGRAQSRIVSCV